MNNSFLTRVCLLIFVIAVLFQCDKNVSNPSNNSGLNISSSPETMVYHNDMYTYTITVEGNQGDYVVEIDHSPAWLDFDAGSITLSGVPTGDYLGTHAVSLSVSDNNETVRQDFNIEVCLKQIDGGPWIGIFPYDWPHDGQPLTSGISVIYSDAANDQTKIEVAGRVENIFNDIKVQSEIINDDMFTFSPGSNKIDIYLNRFNSEYAGGFAYNAGAIVVSPDSPFYGPSERRHELEHEMMHIMEYLLEGGRMLILSEVWFREGIADYYAGNHAITNMVEMESWLEYRRTLPGGGNPILIHQWNDFPDQVADNNTQGLWYPMFELAVRYLLDANGQGKTMLDVKNMFLDMDINNLSFPQAFENNFSVSLQYYEDNFWNLMEDYLE